MPFGMQHLGYTELFVCSWLYVPTSSCVVRVTVLILCYRNISSIFSYALYTENQSCFSNQYEYSWKKNFSTILTNYYSAEKNRFEIGVVPGWLIGLGSRLRLTKCWAWFTYMSGVFALKCYKTGIKITLPNWMTTSFSINTIVIAESHLLLLHHNLSEMSSFILTLYEQ